MKKTMTPSQLEANRRNAARSTGPRTIEGKARVAGNAVTHGLAAALAIPKADSNTFDESMALRADLVRIFKPRTPRENDLINQIVTGYCRLNHLYRFEAAAIQKARAEYEARAAAGQPQAGSRPPVLPHDFELNTLLRHEGQNLHPHPPRLQETRTPQIPPGGTLQTTQNGRLTTDHERCSPTEQTHPAILA